MNRKSALNCNAEITKWLNNAGRYPRLPAHVVNTIGKQIQALPAEDKRRKKLVNKLVEHNLLLVASFVKNFMDKKSHNEWGSAETVDYLQMGVLGLIRAAEKFDPTKGYAFSTYASFWMRSTVGRYNLKTITPVHVSEAAASNLIYYKRNGRGRSVGSKKPQTKAQVEELANRVAMAYQCISLDIQPKKKGKDPLIDLIPSQDQDEEMSLCDIFASIKACGVDDNSIEILRLNFVEKKTVRQISRIMKLPEERVSELKCYALERASKRPELFEVGIL